METYILRIYRRNKDMSHSLVGFVEEVGVEGKKPFKNPGQLSSILNARAAEAVRVNKLRKGKNRKSENVSIIPKV